MLSHFFRRAPTSSPAVPTATVLTLVLSGQSQAHVPYLFPNEVTSILPRPLPRFILSLTISLDSSLVTPGGLNNPTSNLLLLTLFLLSSYSIYPKLQSTLTLSGNIFVVQLDGRLEMVLYRFIFECAP